MPDTTPRPYVLSPNAPGLFRFIPSAPRSLSSRRSGTAKTDR